MGLGTPPLEIKILLESNPQKSTMLVGRLAVTRNKTENTKSMNDVQRQINADKGKHVHNETNTQKNISNINDIHTNNKKRKRQ